MTEDIPQMAELKFERPDGTVLLNLIYNPINGEPSMPFDWETPRGPYKKIHTLYYNGSHVYYSGSHTLNQRLLKD